VSYARELQELPNTLAKALSADVDPLRDAISCLSAGPARFVGTGGTLPIARLAADWHEEIARQPSRSMTPLEFVGAPKLGTCGVVLFSARAKHPDALLALEEMTGGDYRPAVLVTHRTPSDIRLTATTDLCVEQLPRPDLREGFLATNSALMMAAMLLRAYGTELTNSSLVGAADLARGTPVDRPYLLVVYPPRLAAVALDIETRLAELGLCAVQLADLRNIAHGRHTGLARNASKTTVLTISSGESGVFAKRVTNILEGSGAAHVHWHVADDLPAATITLLAASMHLAEGFASEQGIDAGRPRVPVFGRQLYNLPIRRLLRRPPRTPVDQKIDSLGIGAVPEVVRVDYETAYESWRRDLSSVGFGGIVLDYDGTVCLTRQRRKPPSLGVKSEISRLLGEGLVVGFASGRGRSLYEGLREWIAEPHWVRVIVGLYNGSVRLTLADELADQSQPSELMELAHDRLQHSLLKHMIVLEPRSNQVTVEALAGHFHGDRLAELVRDVLAQDPPLPLKVVASGHSLDVIADNTTKVTVIKDVRSLQGGEVLVIGDQGDMGGNDFEMLSATRWSMSVSRCSADPTRCWPSDDQGRRGPDALHALLGTLRVVDGLAHVSSSRRTSRA
jgi:hydroxymethylpyrimidine pyrophosphatase-like HAD family hydrolase